ncbi:hypothetical protein BU24DRAFT_483694 [Aaosphaeria arxii CBS 175.79]|uniref:Uncharacterized protein n=1 Tax=Aaosphaeria arxii CBS 175.79 TaxID=1450172 RepID=A0A6A5XKR1_9PLEO|nr:uncharacterized protein BU24DRAFT_483694 [Aaosphaeria arxii CBS 175.79]KAF2013855.1 hypothetical protein BU24DRAFT_483694 [Aaosphaeria arxii CBS 175.79]
MEWRKDAKPLATPAISFRSKTSSSPTWRRRGSDESTLSSSSLSSNFSSLSLSSRSSNSSLSSYLSSPPSSPSSSPWDHIGNIRHGVVAPKAPRPTNPKFEDIKVGKVYYMSKNVPTTSRLYKSLAAGNQGAGNLGALGHMVVVTAKWAVYDEEVVRFRICTSNDKSLSRDHDLIYPREEISQDQSLLHVAKDSRDFGKKTWLQKTAYVCNPGDLDFANWEIQLAASCHKTLILGQQPASNRH